MDYTILRQRMIEKYVIGRGIKDRRVIQAMFEVPRHLFVEEPFKAKAYGNFSLPIGEDQTISQPYMVAFMTERLELAPDDRVLEIGTGSGYQTSILAALAGQVFSIERIAFLAERAKKLIDRLQIRNVSIKVFDGTYGWREMAPFHAIIVTAATPFIPDSLTDQLAPGGRMIIPVGSEKDQRLIIVIKDGAGVPVEQDLGPCRFVKLQGKYGWNNEQN
jgi:protein-L-isoaspartate(D-aspartate) O-methyltransferase